MERLEIKNEVMRKIGRNVLLYQQVEHILKYLVANGRISGDVSTIKSRHEIKKESVAKKTMGAVAGDFLPKFLPRIVPSIAIPRIQVKHTFR